METPAAEAERRIDESTRRLVRVALVGLFTLLLMVSGTLTWFMGQYFSTENKLFKVNSQAAAQRADLQNQLTALDKTDAVLAAQVDAFRQQLIANGIKPIEVQIPPPTPTGSSTTTTSPPATSTSSSSSSSTPVSSGESNGSLKPSSTSTTMTSGVTSRGGGGTTTTTTSTTIVPTCVTTLVGKICPPGTSSSASRRRRLA